MRLVGKDIKASLIPLSAVAFLHPFGTIDDYFSKLLFIAICVCIYIFTRSSNLIEIDGNLKKYYNVLYLSFFTSLIISVYIHNQGWINSLISIAPYILSFGVLFIIARIGITTKELFSVIRYLTLLGLMIYLINRFTYPNIVFGIKEASSRGGIIRLSIPFLELQVLMFFYYIHQITNSDSRQKKNWLWMCIYATPIILSLTRQMLVAGFGIGMILYIFETKGAKKYLIAILIFIFTICVIPNLRLYRIMAETTNTEISKNNGIENNIRVLAWKYYISDVQESPLTMLFGNGIPALQKTEWGKKIDMQTKWRGDRTGYYVSDVGWAGFFFYFGLIGVFSLIMIFIKTACEAYRERLRWITAWFIFIIITSFASGAIIYYYQITSISMVIYLVYGKDRNHNLGV